MDQEKGKKMKLKLQVKLAALAVFVLLCGCGRESVYKESQPKAQTITAPEANIKEFNRSAPSHYEQLKDLDWLAGNWVDTSENVDANFAYKWGKNKNFFTQNFSIKISGNDELEGEQIICWDPIEKKIRGWIFDSDGGFGNSVWTKQGNNWCSNMIFILPDGKKASATHIYTKMDDNTYAFSANNRDIDGDVLPNIGPYKVIRK